MLGLLVAVVVPSVRAAEEKPVPPNVIVIYIDDMGYGDIGPFGAKGYATPNLDRMAAEGTRFTSFYSVQAVCSASRAGLMTGCYPNRVGIAGALFPHSKVGLAPEETTIAEVCRTRGYATACIGKWHLGDAREFLPPQQGFDEYFGLPYSNDMRPLPGNTHPPLPLLEGNTVVNPAVDDAAQDQLTTWYTERAVDFIRRHKERPFFLYLPHSMVHVPLHVSDKFRGKTERGLFGDAVAELDWSVGEVLGELRRSGIDDRTLVMFCSDNGPWLNHGDHAGSAGPLREGKGTSWDGGVREPTLMRWPGHIPAGRTCDVPLATIDVLPTVAALAGAELPARKIDGVDIGDVITGKSDRAPHEALFFYYHGNDLESMRSGKWKLEFARSYSSLAGKPPGKDGKAVPYTQVKIPAAQLYDLDADPGERSDLAAARPEVVARLSALADRQREELGDELVKRPGTARRAPGKTTAVSVFPSDAGFEKKPEAKYGAR
ncbi:arylsulfatase [Luteolibacter sp. LG18]|nr:arylsulfatase [Luteolibacter sp. LG18]